MFCVGIFLKAEIVKRGGCLIFWEMWFVQVIHVIWHIHSFHWHVQNVTIPCRSQKLLPFLSVMYFFLPPFSILHQLFFHPPSPHLAVYFLVYLSILLFPNSCIILFWELCFLPFSVHVQINVTYITLLSLL